MHKRVKEGRLRFSERQRFQNIDQEGCKRNRLEARGKTLGKCKMQSTGVYVAKKRA